MTYTNAKQHLIPPSVFDIANKVQEGPYYERLVAIRDYCNMIIERENIASAIKNNKKKKKQFND